MQQKSSIRLTALQVSTVAIGRLTCLLYARRFRYSSGGRQPSTKIMQNHINDPETVYIGYSDAELAEREAYADLARLARTWKRRAERDQVIREALAVMPIKAPQERRQPPAHEPFELSRPVLRSKVASRQPAPQSERRPVIGKAFWTAVASLF